MGKILIIGGYGDVGKVVVTELLSRSNKQLMIGGRQALKAEEFLLTVDASRVSFKLIDIYEKITYLDELKDIRMVIMCLSPRTIDFAAYCLKNGIYYLDISASGQTM